MKAAITYWLTTGVNTSLTSICSENVSYSAAGVTIYDTLPKART
jgi:hypothetical protein